MKKLIQIINASIGFGTGKKKKILVSDINIDIADNETVALIGINGSGKSTLLKTILGLIPVLEGNVLISETKRTMVTYKQLAKIVSYVTTESVNVSHLNIRDLVALGRYPYFNNFAKLSKEDDEIISEALNLVEMYSFSKKFVNELSDGERQKVMIARAIAQDTKIMILDEPTSFLDIENKYKIYEILNNLAKNYGKSIIYSTHDLNIVLKQSDKIWLIKNSTILQGAPEDLVFENAFADIFHPEKILFDSETFDFNLIKKLNIPIYLSQELNDKKLYLLYEKALNRNGFFISGKTENIKIFPNENSSFLSGVCEVNNKKLEYNSIHNLLKIIQGKKI